MLTDRIPSKADIRLIRSLGQKKFRQEHGLFVVEGEKMVGEALTQKRYQVEAVYRTSDIGEETMGRMSHLSSPSPALAVLRIPSDGIPDRSSALPSGLCLGLDSVRDPGNVGTILRLADWFGVAGLRGPVQSQDHTGHDGFRLPPENRYLRPGASCPELPYSRHTGLFHSP